MAGSTRQMQAEVASFTRNMEETAYVTYREWPIFLVLRQRQLEAVLQQSGTALPEMSAVPDFSAVITEEKVSA